MKTLSKIELVARQAKSASQEARAIHDRMRANETNPDLLDEIARNAAQACDSLWSILEQLWVMLADANSVEGEKIECLIAVCEGARGSLIPLFRFIRNRSALYAPAEPAIKAKRQGRAPEVASKSDLEFSFNIFRKKGAVAVSD